MPAARRWHTVPMASPLALTGLALRQRARSHAPVLVAVVLSTVWTVLALRRPETTWYGMPALVAAAWPVTARAVRGPATLPVALRAGAGGLLVAVLTVAELVLYDALAGPPLVGASPAVEAVVASLAGAGGGVLVQAWRRGR